MNPEIVPIHEKEPLREDGMLFVRTEGIPETMVKTPLIVAVFDRCCVNDANSVLIQFYSNS